MDDDIVDLDEIERTLQEVEQDLKCRTNSAAARHTGCDDDPFAAFRPGASKKPASATVSAGKVKSTAADARVSASTGKPGSDSKKFMSNDDLSFLDEVEKDCEDLDTSVAQRPATQTQSGKKANSVAKHRDGQRGCFPVYVGGTRSSLGYDPSTPGLCCNNLLCVGCDFTVLSFDETAWASSVDYLFFRNQMPVVAELKKKLQRQKGSRAYCCQCRWLSVKDLTDLQTMRDFHSKWVCRKH